MLFEAEAALTADCINCHLVPSSLIDIGIDMSYSFHLVGVFAESSSSALQLAVCMLLGSEIGNFPMENNNGKESTRSYGLDRSAN